MIWGYHYFRKHPYRSDFLVIFVSVLGPIFSAQFILKKKNRRSPGSDAMSDADVSPDPEKELPPKTQDYAQGYAAWQH